MLRYAWYITPRKIAFYVIKPLCIFLRKKGYLSPEKSIKVAFYANFDYFTEKEHALKLLDKFKENCYITTKKKRDGSLIIKLKSPTGMLVSSGQGKIELRKKNQFFPTSAEGDRYKDIYFSIFGTSATMKLEPTDNPMEWEIELIEEYQKAILFDLLTCNRSTLAQAYPLTLPPLNQPKQTPLN